jgi:hypothetical protein
MAFLVSYSELECLVCTLEFSISICGRRFMFLVCRISIAQDAHGNDVPSGSKEIISGFPTEREADEAIEVELAKYDISGPVRGGQQLAFWAHNDGDTVRWQFWREAAPA